MSQEIRSGGRYEIDKKTGKPKLVEEPTAMPPDGKGGARDADGKPTDVPAEAASKPQKNGA